MTSIPILLPISTRSVGFIIRNLVQMFQYLLEDKCNKDSYWYDLTNALYRVTLMRLHMKINKGFQNCCINPSKSDDPYFPTFETEMLIKILGRDFAVIKNLLSAIGYVQYNGCRFVPYLPPLKWDLRCDPFNVRFTNLHDIVNTLADPKTPVNIRRHFWEYNAIPGAKWSTAEADGEDKFLPDTYLTNPVDIMPDVYELHEDISIIQAGTELISRKYPDYIAKEIIYYESHGSEAQLVSSIAKPIRCPSCIDNGRVGYYGDYDEFWSPQLLKQKEIDLGVLCLFGEHSAAIQSELLSIRCKNVAALSITQHTYWPEITNYLYKTDFF